MRVIAGSAKRLQLKTVPGLHTRPVTDRVKETLFNVISGDVADGVFLDLFAGSGGVGIEALSRGAKEATFVDNNVKAVACIRDNLTHTKLAEKGFVIQQDVLQALRKLNGEKIFDIIYLDPPYNLGLEKQVLMYLSNSKLIHQDTIIIVEASYETSVDYIDELGFELVKEKVYKTNKHIFLCLNT